MKQPIRILKFQLRVNYAKVSFIESGLHFSKQFSWTEASQLAMISSLSRPFTEDRVVQEGAEDGLDALKAVHVGRDHPGVALPHAVDLFQVNGFLK